MSMVCEWIGICFSCGMNTPTTIDTRYGSLPVDGPAEYGPEGQALAVFAAGPAVLATAAGDLVPQHTIDDARRMHRPPVVFHPNGHVRSLPLERRTPVATPLGTLPAELVTFHDNGALARVFPLNGKLSGYWTEADEAGLADWLMRRDYAFWLPEDILLKVDRASMAASLECRDPLLDHRIARFAFSMSMVPEASQSARIVPPRLSAKA